MTHYLLSTYAVEGEAPPDAPPSPEAMQAMQAMMERVIALEADMDSAGAFVFGGHLAGQDAATVVRSSDAEVMLTDGPFAEAKEHIAGFYIIDAEDLDAALMWAGRVSGCVGRPIEVQPFAGSGRVADQFGAADHRVNVDADDPVDTSGEIERVFCEVHGHAVATLVRAFGDISMAEDAAQDAFVVAVERWSRDGIPANPAGWIVTTARNRAVDQFRRSRRGAELTQDAALVDGDAVNSRRDPEGPVSDDRLRLIFTCCHPALRPEHQIALTLRLLGGLSTDEIAQAFLVSEAAMAKRLVRAKYKIRAANIAYRVPARSDLPLRLGAVLSVLYLIYNAGTGDLTAGAPLRHEAIRLARALRSLLPDEPESAGLLALMLLNEARVPARTSQGSAVLLRDQHRPDWNHEMIDEGHRIVRECISLARPGPFQLQAAIQAVHCDASTFDETDWHQIVTLYDHLHALMPTSVVALSRAIAIAEVDGHEVSLALLDSLAPDLADYAPLHAARAASLRTLGRTADAVNAHRRALEAATFAVDREYHENQIEALTTG